MDKVLAYVVGWAKSLFPHEKAVRWILLGVTAALVASMATVCRADESSMQFEIGAQYIRGSAAAVVAGVRWDAPKDAQWEAGLVLIGQGPSDRGVAGLQALYVDGFGKFDIGLGMAYFNRIPNVLGSNLNYSLLVGYRFTPRLALNIRHWSNAGTTERNNGLDILTVSYHF